MKRLEERGGYAHGGQSRTPVPTSGENGMRGCVEFSKIVVALTILLVYPSVFALSWRVVALAEMAIAEKFTGALPYLTAIITPAWAAFATVLGFYFNKSKAENREKIKTAVKRDF